jgi:hypothetical protein
VNEDVWHSRLTPRAFLDRTALAFPELRERGRCPYHEA